MPKQQQQTDGDTELAPIYPSYLNLVKLYILYQVLRSMSSSEQPHEYDDDD